MEESYAVSLQRFAHRQLYSLNRSIFNVACDPDTHCTSLPEESFYLFEIILSRAVSQGNVRNICTVISVIKGSIDQYLHSFFLAVIRGRRLLNTPSLQTSLSREQLSVVFTMNDVTVAFPPLSHPDLHRLPQQVRQPRATGAHGRLPAGPRRRPQESRRPQ